MSPRTRTGSNGTTFSSLIAMYVPMQKTQEQVKARLAATKGSQVIDLVMDEGKASGALLCAGEYVRYGLSRILSCGANGAAEPLVGQIIDIRDYRNIPSQEKVSITHALRSYDEDEDADPPAKSDQYVLIRMMPLLCRNHYKDRELYPTIPPTMFGVHCSSSLHWISAKELKSIAFVFHIDQVHDCRYSCAGIRNAYVVRVAVPCAGDPADQDQWDPFVSPFGDCI
jgi:hypothetical protein